MELNKAIQILKETVETDRNIRSDDKGKPFEELSDYSQFCEEKNIAIERILEELRSMAIRDIVGETYKMWIKKQGIKTWGAKVDEN